MLHLSNIFIMVLLLSFRPFHSKGQTLKIKSSPSGITYVKKGETLTLDVTFTYTGNKTVGVAWWFGKLYERKIIERDVAGSTNSFDKRASIKDTASLVLTNTMVTDNGTYGIRLTVGDVPNDAEEQFTVIINEQPTADTNCTDITVDQGTDVTCRCFNKSGNPPPTASWSKSGVTGTIGGEGYLEKILSLKNVSASDSGTYVCNLQSHDLTDQVSIELKVKSAPDVASFEVDTEGVVLGMSTTITCEAIGFPEPTYTISHNGTVVQNGTTYTIKAVRYEDSGQYECVASNSLGNSSKRLTLIVKEVTPTVTSKIPNSVTDDNGEADDSGSGTSSLGAGAVAGIVIGVLCLIVIVIGLVWWFCFKNGGGKERGGDGPAVRAANSRDDSQYDSVEKEGEPSGSRNSAAGAVAPAAAPSSSADMPPVYASVDKTKKTKKPPPSSPPTSVQYASLDPVALQPDSSRMRVRETNDTQYADLDLEKLQSDLV